MSAFQHSDHRLKLASRPKTLNMQIPVHEFIKLLKSRPALWQKSHPYFLDRGVRSMLLAEISDASGMSASECSRKLKNLKDSMRAHVGRLPKNESGLPAFDRAREYISWPYFKCLLFMKDEFTRKKIPDMELDDTDTDDRVDCKDFRWMYVSNAATNSQQSFPNHSSPSSDDSTFSANRPIKTEPVLELSSETLSPQSLFSAKSPATTVTVLESSSEALSPNILVSSNGTTVTVLGPCHEQPPEHSQFSANTSSTCIDLDSSNSSEESPVNSSVKNTKKRRRETNIREENLEVLGKIASVDEFYIFATDIANDLRRIKDPVTLIQVKSAVRRLVEEAVMGELIRL